MSRCRLEPGSDVRGGAGSRAAVVMVWYCVWTVSTLVPAEGLSGISRNTTCETYFYFDHGTDSCEHCCDICCYAQQAGVEDQCESLCGAYAQKMQNDAQQKKAVEMEIPSRRSTTSSSNSNTVSIPVGAQVAIYIACVASLVTLFVVIFVKRKAIVNKCRRGAVFDQQDPESAVPLQPQQDSSTALEMVVVGPVCVEAHSTRIQPQMDLSPALDPATAGGAVCGEAHSTRIQPQVDISPALDPATAGGAFCGEAHSTRIQPQLDLSPALDPATAGGAVCGEAHSTRIQPQVDISPALELATAGDAVCGADQCSTVLQPQTLQMKTPIQVTQVESLRSWSLPDLLDQGLISETREEQNTELKTFLR